MPELAAFEIEAVGFRIRGSSLAELRRRPAGFGAVQPPGKVAGNIALHLRDIGQLALVALVQDDALAVGADDEPPAVKREWSDAELNELGDMLVRGLSIEEIARLLRRDHDDVQNVYANFDMSDELLAAYDG